MAPALTKLHQLPWLIEELSKFYLEQKNDGTSNFKYLVSAKAAPRPAIQAPIKQNLQYCPAINTSMVLAVLVEILKFVAKLYIPRC